MNPISTLIRRSAFPLIFALALTGTAICAEPTPGNSMPGAADLVPSTDKNSRSGAEGDEGSKKSDSDTPEYKPLSIHVSPHDKKANLAIEKNLKMYSSSMKERFAIYLERSGRYLDMMQDILKGRDMPAELVFLPIVESGFSTKAYSRARAAGPWQFIAGTAKRYGLVIDWWRDERKDPVKSTLAAASYLRDLHNMFGSWSLALAAYNAGEGKIARALRRTSSDDFWPLLSTRHIRKETKDYVPRYIAASMIANSPKVYGFEDLSYHSPFKFDEVLVYVPIDLDVVAECAGTDLDTIRELNPELRRWSTPANVSEYTLRVPAGKADMFIENIEKVPDEKIFTFDTYIVKKNDTVKKIAAKTKIPANAIMELNSLSGIERLAPGTELRMPPRDKFFADVEDRLKPRKVKNKKKAAKHKSKTALKKSHSAKRA